MHSYKHIKRLNISFEDKKPLKHKKVTHFMSAKIHWDNSSFSDALNSPLIGHETLCFSPTTVTTRRRQRMTL